MENLEKAQARYFKYLFYWPTNTPNYIIRRETGMEKIAIGVIEKFVKWWIKILEMPENRYPKICFQVLREIESREPLQLTHNWAAQLRNILIQIGYENLYRYGTAEEVQTQLENIKEAFRRKFFEEDTDRILASSYSRLYRSIMPGVADESYLSRGTDIRKIRVVSQLRVAWNQKLRIYVNGNSYNIDTTLVCSICNLGEREDLAHFLLRCPMYRGPRTLLKDCSQSNINVEEKIKCLLTLDSEEKVRHLFRYTETSLKIRSFILMD